MLLDLYGQAAAPVCTPQHDRQGPPAAKNDLPADDQKASATPPDDTMAAVYFSLAWRAASPAAKALCDDLTAQVLEHWSATAKAHDPDRRPRKTRLTLEGFIGAMVASLPQPEPRPLFRSWMMAGFSKTAPAAVEGIGYRPAKAVRDVLIQLGYLEQIENHRFDIRASEPGQDRSAWLPNRTATYRATTSFEALAASYGGPEYCLFRSTLPVWPLALNWARRPGAVSTKPQRSVPLPRAIQRSALVRRLVGEMREINAFLDSFDLTGEDGTKAFFGLHRIFSLPADHDPKRLDAYQWHLHGRLYARGGGGDGKSYQCMSGDQRLGLLIDGETVAELDIRASWPTIVYGLMSRELPDFKPDRWADADVDPYSGIPDLETGEVIPRSVVKAASSIFLMNTGSNLRKWPEETVEDLKEAFSNLLNMHPAARIGKSMLQARPHLTQWKVSKQGGGLRLMNLEADMLMATMRQAMAAGIPAYPVHDAVLVPESQAAAVQAMLVDQFVRSFGVRPHVRAKVT